MKLDETRLSRAFTDAPIELSDAVEAAFRRGETAMKKRHKMMLALSAAAACAVIFAALALAAGRLTAPRKDPVAAARGGSSEPVEAQWTAAPDPVDEGVYYYTEGGQYFHTDAHCMGMRNAEPHTLELALANGKSPCPTCVKTRYYYTREGRYYHSDPQCSGMRGAEAHSLFETLDSGKAPCPVCVDEAMEGIESLFHEENGNTATASMTAQEAWEKLLEADPTAGKSGQVWLYLSSEVKAAWAFYATGKDSGGALWKGAAWFIGGEACVCLGRSDSVESWFFFTPHPGPDPVSDEANALEPQGGSYVGYGPELFSSRIRKGKTTEVHLWMIGEDGLPLELDTGSGLAWVEAYDGVLFGSRNSDDSDWVFLHAHDQLYQVTAQAVSNEDAATLPGVTAIFSELQSIGYTVTDCLYRNLDQLGSGAAAITVNLEQGGKDYHAYLFRRDYDARFIVMTGWEDDINVYPGRGTFNPDAGLPALPSPTLEVDVFIQQKGAASKR